MATRFQALLNDPFLLNALQFNTELIHWKWILLKEIADNKLLWYHVKIREEDIESFMQMVKRVKDKVLFLPYWCLCDNHKNMICFMPSEYNKQFKRYVKVNFSKPIKRCKDLHGIINFIRRTGEEYISYEKMPELYEDISTSYNELYLKNPF